MSLLTYSRLQTITSTQKPYRGTTDRYPLASRRHIHKNFYVDDLNGERVFRITYGNTHKEFAVTKEEYMANQNTFHEVHWRAIDHPLRYVRYELHARELGIVRPDNTFEFTAKHYGQGERQLLSNGIGALSVSTRHGGLVIKNYVSPFIMHPIFKNMRLNMDTMQVHDSCNYKMYGKRVNRGEGKKFLSQFEDFFKITEVMLKNMEWKSFLEGSSEVMKELMGEDKFEHTYYLEDYAKRDMAKLALERIHTAPFDACVLYCVAYDINRLYYSMHSSNRYVNDLENLFINMKRRVSKELYKANPSVMSVVEYETGKPYPASEWGVDIFVNGVEVEQLT